MRGVYDGLREVTQQPRHLEGGRPHFPFPFFSATAMTAPMKAIFASILLTAAGLLFSGCESDVPPDPNIKPGGPTGRGSLVQPDKSEDPLIRENTRVGY
jgi:hypothetical protein